MVTRGLRRPPPDLIAKARDDTAAQVNRVFLALVGTAAFCLLSLLTPDISLLTGNEKINVPGAGPVSFLGFMLIGPAVLIVLRIYLQIYVEHERKLDRIARRMSAARAPTVAPDKNLLMRVFIGLAFYLLLPLLMLAFFWKAAVFPHWGTALLSVAAAVIAMHRMLLLPRLSWGQRATLSLVAAIMAGGLMLSFGPWQRPFNLFRANLSDQWLAELDLKGANLNRANLSAANLTRANLIGADLSAANLGGTNLRGADLRGANLGGTNLSAANLSGTDLRGAIIEGADLSGANFSGANLSGANLADANPDLSGANFSGANLSGANLADANLKGANISDANLQAAILTRADLIGAILTRADLRGAILTRADLSGAKLGGAKLTGADLIGATLSGATLRGAELSGANLGGAELSGANLSDADLSGADLSDADLSDAELSGADLSEADLTVTRGLDQQRLDTACGDQRTKLPPGLTLLRICSEIKKP
jgi:uncharacterized protein YjbI with pentapeptide repeats